MFFDRRECLSVFIFSVCLHYSLWTPSEMLCALHHWTAGKGAAPDAGMPVGHQHSVAGEVKKIAFIFIFLQCWKTVVWRVILFFPCFFITMLLPRCPPLFHVSCPRLPGLWLCIGVYVGEAAHVDNLPHSMFTPWVHVLQLWTGECWMLWMC